LKVGDLKLATRILLTALWNKRIARVKRAIQSVPVLIDEFDWNCSSILQLFNGRGHDSHLLLSLHERCAKALSNKQTNKQTYYSIFFLWLMEKMMQRI
jgi:hypothetical protein